VQAALGLILASWSDMVDFGVIRACLIAAIPAALAAVQNALEARSPWTG